MARKSTKQIALNTLLLNTSFVIRKHGWMGKTKARQTGAVATVDMISQLGDAVKPTRTDKKIVAETLSWLKTLIPNSEYELKLQDVILAGIPADTIRDNQAGIAASAVGVYLMRKDQEKANAKRAEEAGPFVGKKGQRVDFEATLEGLRFLDRWNCFLHVWKDANGSELCWMTSSKHAEVGDVCKVRGTVKSHRVYRGAKSTGLNRCTVEVVK